MNRKILALLTLAVALGLAAVALGDYPMPVGLYVPGIQQWQSAPSTPTTVSASQGYVPMTGAAVTFTTPPSAGATVEAEFNVQFGASNANVANCVADISISGFPTASYGTDGYAQPSYSLGGYVSTTAGLAGWRLIFCTRDGY
jgi:hypothetical protein